jgi:predicted NAD-dependent protein-ADP-ribosyltransferase YbiA (DUF1768 family)
MVLSLIDSNINYIEKENIDKQDTEYESYVYRGRIYNKNIKFVLGRPNFEFVDNNIVYFNIYLANKENVVCRIGVYETENSIYRTLLDEDGIIIVEKMNEPIMFPFAKPYIMLTYKLEDDIHALSDNKQNFYDSDTDSDSDSDVDSDAKEIDSDDDFDYKRDIQEQSKEASVFERENYQEQSNDKWINKYMKSYMYSTTDNEGGGDCFFAVLRDALKSLDLEKYNSISVKSIRENLANEVDDKVYNNYKQIAQLYYGGLKNTQDKLSKYKKNHNIIKKMIGGTTNSEDKNKLLSDAKDNLGEIINENDKKKEYSELVDEFEFMKDVKTIDDFKNIIKTTAFWADVWAISTLERIYNVKFIILSKENYDNDELDNVLQCGEADKKIQEKEIFEPDYYIITEYSDGSHYKLITYDKNINKAAFRFKEVPYRLRELVLQKCMEKNAGLFALIPDFRKFAHANNVFIQKPTQFDTLMDKPKSDFYDDSIVLQIYAKSVDKKPGEGTGDIVPPEFKTSSVVTNLGKIKNWRKKLDNSWLMTSENDDLEIKGNKWISVQHFIYASRFYNLPHIYNKFVKDSDSDASKTVEAAKSLYDKTLKDKTYKSTIVSEKDYKNEESKIILTALISKFSKNEHFKDILLKTENVKIIIYKPGKGSEDAIELMKVRELLAK